jgi:hypothetical protein
MCAVDICSPLITFTQAIECLVRCMTTLSSQTAVCPQCTHRVSVCCGAVNQPLLSGQSVQVIQQLCIVLAQSLLYQCLLTSATQPAHGSLVIQQQPWFAASEHLSLEPSCLRGIWLGNKHEQLQFKHLARKQTGTAPVQATSALSPNPTA